EETAADLARLEDLVSEVQTQVRSLARQRGKAERYGKMIEERFGIALTLVRRELEDFDLTLGGLGQRAEQLAAALPGERNRLEAAEQERDTRVPCRRSATSRRSGRSWQAARHSSRRGATACWRSARRCASSKRTCSGGRRVPERSKASGRRSSGSGR